MRRTKHQPDTRTTETAVDGPLELTDRSTPVIPRYSRPVAVSLLLTAALLLALLFPVWLLHRPPTQYNWTAFQVYYGAGVDLRHGHSPYGSALAWAAAHPATDWRNILTNVYPYPPLLALLFEAATVLPLRDVSAAWYILAVVCALYAAVFLTRLAVPGVRGLSRAVACALGLDAILVFGPVRHEMLDGQADIPLIALLLGAWAALRAERRLTSGILLGLAIAIKPMYVIFIGLYLWRREWRAGATALLAGGIGVALPFLLAPHQSLADYLSLLSAWSAPGYLRAPRSISAFGVLQGVFYTSPLFWRIFTAPFVAKALSVMLGVSIYVAASGIVPAEARRGSAHDNYAWGLAVLVLLLGSPLTDPIYLSLTIIPLTLITAPLLARLQRGERASWLPLALVALYFIAETVPVRTLQNLGQHRLGISSYYLFSIGLGYIAVFGLVGLTALYIWAGRQTPYRFTGPSVLAEAWQRLATLSPALARSRGAVPPQRTRVGQEDQALRGDDS